MQIVNVLKDMNMPFFKGESKPQRNIQQNKDNKNPISTTGEREMLLKGAVAAGIGFGAKLLFSLWENGFELESLWNLSDKLLKKNKKDNGNLLLHVGGFAAITVGFVGAVAALYTVLKTPQILYDGKINSFKKGKDMDVYIKSNKVEKELYEQINDKAKAATTEEKKVLAQQYLKLKAAKNPVPDFVQINN